MANQLVTHQDSTGTTAYVFDATGNQQVVVAPAATRTTTTWDHENQPTQFQDQTGVLQTAKYTAEQLRVEKVASGTTTKFLWDGARYVAEYDGTNAVKLLYSGEPTAYGSIYSQNSKSGAIWTPRQFHADCIGSVRSITDSTAIVTDTRTFAAFGTTVASSGSTIAALKFCGVHGYYGDFGTQYYVRARMYDCLLGRFTARDRARYRDLLNAYANASHLRYVDPLGLWRIVGVSAPPNPRYIYMAEPGDEPAGTCRIRDPQDRRRWLQVPCPVLPNDDEQGPTYLEGIDALFDGMTLLLDMCRRCDLPRGCEREDCVQEVYEIRARVIAAWHNNYGQGCYPLDWVDPVAGFYCWDWAWIFEDALLLFDSKCWKWKVWAARDPGGSGVHYWLQLWVVADNGHPPIECRAAVDDAFFDGKTVHPWGFEQPWVRTNPRNINPSKPPCPFPPLPW